MHEVWQSLENIPNVQHSNKYNKHSPTLKQQYVHLAPKWIPHRARTVLLVVNSENGKAWDKPYSRFIFIVRCCLEHVDLTFCSTTLSEGLPQTWFVNRKWPPDPSQTFSQSAPFSHVYDPLQINLAIRSFNQHLCHFNNTHITTTSLVVKLISYFLLVDPTIMARFAQRFNRTLRRVWLICLNSAASADDHSQPSTPNEAGESIVIAAKWRRVFTHAREDPG